MVCGVNENNFTEFYVDGVHQNSEGIELWKKSKLLWTLTPVLMTPLL